MQNYPTPKTGFSLVELSIVLVILGLLTGGILGGQELIKAAELRAITTEFQKWQTGVNTFRQKYLSYPGDMRNATQFWGAYGTCPPAAEEELGNATCNGDGDGVIALHDGSVADSAEHFLFWQHMALAGLVEGEYSGSRGTVNRWHHDIGVNAPRSRFGSAGWGVDSGGDHTDIQYAIDTTNALNFGSDGTEIMYEPVLTPEEAWNIDTKLDDGRPGRGVVIAIQYGDCDDAGSNTDYDSEYRLSEDDIACALYFRNGL